MATIVGTSANDTLFGTNEKDGVWGLGGNDRLDGGTGSDFLYGGAGNDVLTSSDDFDRLDGGDDDDRLVLSGVGGAVTGGAGVDTLAIDLSGRKDALVLNALNGHGIIGDASLAANHIYLRDVERLDLTLGSGNDRVQSGNGDDSLHGGGGIDFLDSGDGDDALWGGEGNDSLRAGDGDDVLYGEDGNDFLDGDFGNDVLYGGLGDDGLSGYWGDDRIEGGVGNDGIGGGEGNDVLLGGEGDDRIADGAGDDETYGGDGHDQLQSDGGSDKVFGEEGDDRLQSDVSADVLDGGNGNDWLNSGGGLDNLVAGDGDDALIDGESGMGTGYIGGHASISAGAGNDSISVYAVGTLTNNIDGGDGHDTLNMGFASPDAAFDFDAERGLSTTGLIVTNIEDFVIRIYNDEGSTLRGGGGDDVFTGEYAFNGTSQDIFDGRGGNDGLFGGTGDDQLNGGDGNDVLAGDSGADILAGGSGADTFIWNGGAVLPDNSVDHIVDFDTTGGDVIEFHDFTVSAGHDIHDYASLLAASRDTEGGVYVSFEGDQVNGILIEGVTLADFSADDIVFT